MTTSTVTTGTAALILRTGDEESPITAGRNNIPMGLPSESVESEFLTWNGSPTGLEPVMNPQGWPDDHRRVPPYRAPVVNPAWDRIVGDTLGIRIFMWTILSGCQLLQWIYTAPRSLGLHAKGICMYKIANEW